MPRNTKERNAISSNASALCFELEFKPQDANHWRSTAPLSTSPGPPPTKTRNGHQTSKESIRSGWILIVSCADQSQPHRVGQPWSHSMQQCRSWTLAHAARHSYWQRRNEKRCIPLPHCPPSHYSYEEMTSCCLHVPATTRPHPQFHLLKWVLVALHAKMLLIKASTHRHHSTSNMEFVVHGSSSDYSWIFHGSCMSY